MAPEKHSAKWLLSEWPPIADVSRRNGGLLQSGFKQREARTMTSGDLSKMGAVGADQA